MGLVLQGVSAGAGAGALVLWRGFLDLFSAFVSSSPFLHIPSLSIPLLLPRFFHISHIALGSSSPWTGMVLRWVYLLLVCLFFFFAETSFMPVGLCAHVFDGCYVFHVAMSFHDHGCAASTGAKLGLVGTRVTETFSANVSIQLNCIVLN